MSVPDTMNWTDILRQPPNVVPREHHFSEFTPSAKYVSNEVRIIMEILVDQTLSFVVSLMGLFTNIVVIIVFAMQGYKDSVSISMTTIAIWDFIKSLSGALQRTFPLIALFSEAKAYSWRNIGTAVFNYTNSFSCYVTSVLAAYVAIERCFCVTMPLKVKWLLTKKVSFSVCLFISITVFGWFTVVFGFYDIYWVNHPKYNESVAVISYSDFATNNTLLFDFYNMSGVVWPMFCLVVIAITNVIIAHKLRQASKFRNVQTTPGAGGDPSKLPPAGGGKINTISKRDQQVVKMLLVIILIYIFTLMPRVGMYMGKFFEPGFYFLRKYYNLFAVVCFWVFVLDYINGSINMFVFIAMSSSFRATFLELITFPDLSDNSLKDIAQAVKTFTNIPKDSFKIIQHRRRFR